MTSRIRGLDFSASTAGRKRNHLVEDGLCDSVLRIETIEALRDAEAFASALRQPVEWVMGVDFPFGLPLAFPQGMGWEPVRRTRGGHIRLYRGGKSPGGGWLCRTGLPIQ